MKADTSMKLAMLYFQHLSLQQLRSELVGSEMEFPT